LSLPVLTVVPVVVAISALVAVVAAVLALGSFPRHRLVYGGAAEHRAEERTQQRPSGAGIAQDTGKVIETRRIHGSLPGA
jgi:hypothetical protein